MIPPKPFYMIRHGESTANEQQILAGQTQTPLTMRGIQQAQEERSVLESLATKPSVILHSHLPRAKHTAEILNEGLQLPMIEIEDLQEQCFGEWEDVPYTECVDDLRAGIDPPNGESHADFNERVRRIKNEILAQHDMPMMVCHGGIFFAFYRLYNREIPWVANARLYAFNPTQNQDFPWKVSIVGEEQSSSC